MAGCCHRRDVLAIVCLVEEETHIDLNQGVKIGSLGETQGAGDGLLSAVDLPYCES